MKGNSLIEHCLHVPDSSRVCSNHLYTNDWNTLYESAETVFTPEQLRDILDLLRDAYNAKSGIDFEDLDSISPEELYHHTGLTREQFLTILSENPPLSQNTKRPKTVLGCYLMKMRSAEPDNRIACHLNINMKTVSSYLRGS